jgi:thiol-disulfide isomerase/thioredoxin
MSHPPEIPPRIGAPVPEAVFLDAAGAKRSTREILAGSKGLPTLFAFFKVSCPTCQLAWPYVQRLHELYGGRAVRVAGVCQNAAPEGAAYYRTYGGAAFDLFVDAEPRFDASNAFGVESVPHLVLVSPEGKVVRVQTGWSRREMEELGREIAKTKGLTVTPVVPPADPVKDFQAG